MWFQISYLLPIVYGLGNYSSNKICLYSYYIKYSCVILIIFKLIYLNHRLGLVNWFNGISTFDGYLLPNSVIYK